MDNKTIRAPWAIGAKTYGLAVVGLMLRFAGEGFSLSRFNRITPPLYPLPKGEREDVCSERFFFYSMDLWCLWTAPPDHLIAAKRPQAQVGGLLLRARGMCSGHVDHIAARMSATDCAIETAVLRR